MALPPASAGDWFFRASIAFATVTGALLRPGFAPVFVSFMVLGLIMNVARPTYRQRFFGTVVLTAMGLVFLVGLLSTA